MSNLTETFCLKVSKEIKSFLDDTDNSSDYVRQLIFQNMRIRDKAKIISSLEEADGKKYYAFDKEMLRDLISDEVLKTIQYHIFKETDIVLKKK